MKAEIYNIKKWINLTEPKKLVDDFTEILKLADFKIVGFVDYHFENKGYTCVWIISESHFAVHTFPEENKTYIELSSCNEQKNKLFKQILEKKYSDILTL